MLKKVIYIILFSLLSLHAATMNTDKDSYKPDENIVVTLTDLRGNPHDWIVLYPKGTANNDYGKIIQWQYTGGGKNETVTFNNIPKEGTYDIRVLYGNDMNTVVSKEVVVSNNDGGGNGGGNANDDTTLTTLKDNYTKQENIVVTLKNLRGSSHDWIVIYPKGTANNDYGKIVQWQFTGGGKNETVTFNNIPKDGTYDIRVLYGSDMNTVVSKEIVIGEVQEAVELTMGKDQYSPYELLYVNFLHMVGDATGSVGIFNVNAGDAKENAIELRNTEGVVDGELTFNGLPSGTYEARAYVGNVKEKTVTFTVVEEEVSRILYDDFENGVIGESWVRYAGKDMVLLNYGVQDGGAESTERKDKIQGQHALRTFNSDGMGAGNSSGYYYIFPNPENKKLKFLEIDMSIGVSSHRFAFGVKVRTKFGDRRIEFASFYNHVLASNGKQIIRGPYGNVLEGHKEADTVDNYLHVHPAPSDYYVGTSAVGKGTNKFVHYKINIEEKLRVLEPDNELLGITLFTTSGGDYDNLALTTQ